MQNNYDPLKLASLKIASMSWWDRKWILKRIPKDQQLPIKQAIKELSKLGLRNKKVLTQAIKNNKIEKQHGTLLSLYINDLLDVSSSDSAVTPHSLELLSKIRKSLSEVS